MHNSSPGGPTHRQNRSDAAGSAASVGRPPACPPAPRANKPPTAANSRRRTGRAPRAAGTPAPPQDGIRSAAPAAAPARPQPAADSPTAARGQEQRAEARP